MERGGTASAQLGPAQRAAALGRLAAEPFDLLVIGGGITGAGAALDAATRGLRVALVEQRDWAAGTSSRSSKLIHGGLRYLERLDFRLVREALHEQTLMIERLCPHLVRPLPFLFPLRRRIWERLYMGAGILLYDLLAGHRAVPRHRHLTRAGALGRFPGLRRDALVGAIQYYDAQMDDARHTLAVVRTAALHGAVTISSARAMNLLRGDDGRVCGARVRDLEGGAESDVQARQVINATGVWTDQIEDLAGAGGLHVRASKGIHLVVPGDRIEATTALALKTATSVLFVLPWKRHWIIGTTDTDWNLDLAHPAASRKDIEYLLETVNRVLARPLTLDDIEGVYAGLRPLLHGESEATSQLSREHAVTESAPGLLSIAGGKYTTYRIMAKDVIDAAVQRLGGPSPPCRTHEIPLVGAAGYAEMAARREQLARESGVTAERIDHLLGRYGSALTDIVAALRERPDLARPLEGAEDYLRAEIWYAAASESALHLDDVLTRRTRISIETFDRGLRSMYEVGALMGEVLGWNARTLAREIEHYAARVAAERDSQEQPDDRTADAARLGAPDVRMGARR